MIFLILLSLNGCAQNSLPENSIPPETEIYEDPFNTAHAALESSCLPPISRRLGSLSVNGDSWIKGNSSLIPSSVQIKNAESLHSSYLKELEFIHDKRTDTLNQLLGKLQAVVNKEYSNNIKYKVFLITGKDGKKNFNAFCSGSHVYVGLAAYNSTNTESEKASILGHEIGHSILGHITNYYRQKEVASKVFGSNFSSTLSNIYSDIRPLNQIRELASDYVSCYLLYKAGYKSDAGADWFITISKLEGDRSDFSNYLSSHPHPRLRSHCINEFVLQAKQRAKKTIFINQLKKITRYDK